MLGRVITGALIVCAALSAAACSGLPLAGASGTTGTSTQNRNGGDAYSCYPVPDTGLRITFDPQGAGDYLCTTGERPANDPTLHPIDLCFLLHVASAPGGGLAFTVVVAGGIIPTPNAGPLTPVPTTSATTACVGGTPDGRTFSVTNPPTDHPPAVRVYHSPPADLGVIVTLAYGNGHGKYSACLISMRMLTASGVDAIGSYGMSYLCNY